MCMRVRGQRQNVCLYRVHALNYLPPFDDSCNHTRVENLIFIGQRFFFSRPSNVTLLTPSPRPLLSYLSAAAAFWTSHFCFPLPPTPHPHPPPISSPWPACPSLLLLSLLPQGYISLLHGLASSLSLFPFIYINEQKSPFHLPPDEQTPLGEEDRRKEEPNTEEHSVSHSINSTASSTGNII